ncbi:tyrosine-type recombinase/integrase [Inhella sp.]|uniref:tyrosine-type recombinase/integrase n=1 Tax=Inhella sp. TaxID=1921806 RepID=UPI0035B198C2
MTAHQELRAVCIAGMALNLDQSALIARVSDGARKIATAAGWAKLIHRQVGKAELVPLLAHITEHVGRLDETRGDLNNPQRAWLSDLKRLCALIEQAVQATRPSSPRPQPARPMPPDIQPDDESEPSLVFFFEDEDADEGKHEDDTGDETDGAELSGGGPPDPEAPRSRPLARPKKPGDLETSQGGEARRARTGFFSARENQQLVWDNSRLSPEDARALITHLEGLLRDPSAGQRNQAGLLALAMSTGSLTEDVAALSRLPQSDQTWLGERCVWRYVAPQRSSWQPTEALRGRLRTSARHVPLALPASVVGWLNEVLPVGDERQLCGALNLDVQDILRTVRELLAQLRASSGGQQTLSRVETWLPVALSQGHEGRAPDHVPAYLLCAVMDAQHCPAAYYRAYPLDQLAKHHHEVMQLHGWPVETPAPMNQDAWIGTALNPKAGELRNDLRALRSWAQGVASNAALPLHERHNAREVAEVLSLLLLHGLRPVSDPFESLELLDTKRRLLLVDDKFQSEARAHRLIPQSSFGCACVEAHIEHVRRLIAELMPKAPQTAQRLRCMLEKPEWRAAPFRFLLDENFGIVPITRRAMAQHLGERWPWPFNVGRHAGSIEMLGRGVEDRALQSFFGHTMLGHQNRSTWSPLSDEQLYATLRAALDDWAQDLDLMVMPSFLAPPLSQVRMPALIPRPSPMRFGHERRADQRAAKQLRLREEVEEWTKEELKGRPPSKLTQSDINALFERVRRATANATSGAASLRFELMRSLLVDWIAQYELVDLELPAVGLSLRDHAHVCPMDGLSAARWLDGFDAALNGFWDGQRADWKRGVEAAQGVDANALLLSLCTTALVIDPELWLTWLKAPAAFRKSQDPEGVHWLHLTLPSGNLRQYAVPPTLAALMDRVPDSAWGGVSIATLDASLAAICRSVRLPDPGGFWKFLSRLQSALAVDCPGLVLGQADGSHKSVSPTWMYVERLGGGTPTLTSLAEHTQQKEERAAALRESSVRCAFDSTEVDLNLVKDYRAAMRKAMATLARITPSKSKPGPGQGNAPHATDNASGESRDTDDAQAGQPAATGSRAKSPLERCLAQLDAIAEGLIAKPELPAICRLTFEWIRYLASVEFKVNQRYSPKTIRNYWFSWGLRMIEEASDLDPRLMLSTELEELYSTTVEEAVLDDKTHLYAPARSFHRWLMHSEGVAEIDWSEFRALAGVDHKYINANLIEPDEYRTALGLLLNDRWVDKRRRIMQAAVLVILYRFGLRVGEALGLQNGDLHFSEFLGTWCVRVRGNGYRRLKTSAARRVVPCLERIDEQEQEILRHWDRHVVGGASQAVRPPLFAQAASGPNARTFVPRQSITRRVAEALRCATADPQVRVHHLRHSWATRMLAQVVSFDSAGSVQLDQVLERANSQTCGQSLRAWGGSLQRLSLELVNERDPSRRLVWGIAALLGHASPATTLNVYAHAGHHWLQEWCRRHRWEYWSATDDLLLAWCGNRIVKSLQKQRQRLAARGEVSNDVLIRSIAPEWNIGGQRVERPNELAPLRLIPDADRLASVLRVLQFAVRMHDPLARGAADVLMEEEAWVEAIIESTRQWTDTLVGERRARAGGLWVDPPLEQALVGGEANWSALKALESWPADRLAALQQAMAEHLHLGARMLVVRDLQDAVKITQLLRDWAGAGQVEVLLPADTVSAERVVPKGPLAADREQAKARARRIYKHPNSSLAHLLCEARNLGLPVCLHARLPLEQSDWHMRGRATRRLAIRVRRDGKAAVGSATDMAVLGMVTVCAALARERLGF